MTGKSEEKKYTFEDIQESYTRGYENGFQQSQDSIKKKKDSEVFKKRLEHQRNKTEKECLNISTACGVLAFKEIEKECLNISAACGVMVFKEKENSWRVLIVDNLRKEYRRRRYDGLKECVWPLPASIDRNFYLYKNFADFSFVNKRERDFFVFLISSEIQQKEHDCFLRKGEESVRFLRNKYYGYLASNLKTGAEKCFVLNQKTQEFEPCEVEIYDD